MNKKNIKIDQTLHGYSQGHHLLATSIALSKSSQRTMSVLSDLSGPEVYEGFSEYLTGYPLKEDNYYALGKTWYASEMKRPGCVWTQTLLVKFDDLEKIGDGTILFSYFDRPQQDFNKDDYTNSIELHPYINDDNLVNRNNIKANELRYFMWSLYSNDKPIILPSESTYEYQRMILFVWQNQWSNFRKRFTFCTGTLANRKLGNQTFDVQIVPYSLSKSISRSDQESIVLDDENMKASLSEYPKWLSYVTDELLNESNVKFKEFLETFGSTFEGRDCFSKFAKLYVETDAKNRMKGIGRYLTVAKTIFKKNDYDQVTRNVFEQLFTFFPNKWFNYSDLPSFLQEISTTQNLGKILYKESQLKAQLESLWKSNKNNAKYLFKGLISHNLNQLGESLLKKYSQIIKPEQLPNLTDMDLGACNVLVSLNPEFALCSEIWQQSRDFQCEIIDCIDRDTLNDSLKQKIIDAILENSSEVLSDQVFGAFGNISINIFLDWCIKKIGHQERKIKAWMKICVNNPEVCIKWISSIEALDVRLLVLVVSVLDPYSEMVRQYDINLWYRVFEQLNQKELESHSRLALAQFFLPLILMSNESVADDFIEFSFYPIHDELAINQFDYEQWIKLKPLLPSMSWYNSWDKCKRLRMAMEQKGYLLV